MFALGDGYGFGHIPQNRPRFIHNAQGDLGLRWAGVKHSPPAKRSCDDRTALTRGADFW